MQRGWGRLVVGVGLVAHGGNRAEHDSTCGRLTRAARRAHSPPTQEELPRAATHTIRVENAGERELLITRAFDAPRASVFRALTTPALVKRWLLGPGGWTMPVCEIDLKPGGTFRYVWRRDREEMGVSGTFREIVPPERIVQPKSSMTTGPAAGRS